MLSLISIFDFVNVNKSSRSSEKKKPFLGQSMCVVHVQHPSVLKAIRKIPLQITPANWPLSERTLVQ